MCCRPGPDELGLHIVRVLASREAREQIELGSFLNIAMRGKIATETQSKITRTTSLPARAVLPCTTASEPSELPTGSCQRQERAPRFRNSLTVRSYDSFARRDVAK